MKTRMFAMGMVGALLLSMAATGSGGARQAPPTAAEKLYQEALMKKDNDGDLDAAIVLFQKILGMTPLNRAVAGRAQYQLGQCYEKLGRTEAEKAYRKVLSDFADQPETVKLAQGRLAQLEKPSGPATDSDAFVLREIKNPGRDILSPDGRYRAFSDKDENLCLQEIGSSEIKIIRKGDAATTGIDEIVWSPSGKMIAFARSDPEDKDHLCVIGREGAAAKDIFFDPHSIVSGIVGWLPDDKGLVILITEILSGQIRKQSVQIFPLDGGPGATFDIPEGRITGWKLSPDGTLFAYDYQTEQGRSRVSILPLGNPRVSFPLPDSSAMKIVDWTSKGHLLYLNDRLGDNSLFIQKFHQGKPDREGRFIRNLEARPFSLKMDRTDALLFREWRGGSDVLTADVDLETGKILRAPEYADPQLRGQTSLPVWSPDGGKLGYFVNKSPDFYKFSLLKIRDIKTGEEKEFPLLYSAIMFSSQPKWSNDGKRILYLGSVKNGNGLVAIDAERGTSQIIYEFTSISGWTSDGKIVILNKRIPGITPQEVRHHLIRKDLESGQEFELLIGKPGEIISSGTLSPDDKMFAFTRTLATNPGGEPYYVIPVKGGNPLAFAKFRGPDFAGVVPSFWAADGKGALYAMRRLQNGRFSTRCELWFVPAFDPATAKRLELEGENIFGLASHPNGKTIAIVSQQSVIIKYWVMENFVPKDLR